MRTIRRMISAAAIGAALALVGAAGALAQQEPESDAIAAAEARVSTTMSTTDRMMAPVMIGSAGPYAFIVDTAAERSVVSRQMALELNLTPAGRGRVTSMTHTRETPMFSVPNVSFGSGRTQDLRAFALEGEHLGAGAHGVLGIDALRGQRVVLDFEAGELRVGAAPRRLPPVGPDDIIVRGRSRFGQLVLVDADAEGQPVDVIVDSGLQVSIGNEPLRTLLLGRRGQFERIYLYSVTGETLEADYTRVDNLRVGGFTLQHMPVAFANAHVFDRLHLSRRPALMLGMDALRMFRSVTVDFRNRRAHFVLPEGVANAAGAGG